MPCETSPGPPVPRSPLFCFGRESKVESRASLGGACGRFSALSRWGNFLEFTTHLDLLPTYCSDALLVFTTLPLRIFPTLPSENCVLVDLTGRTISAWFLLSFSPPNECEFSDFRILLSSEPSEALLCLLESCFACPQSTCRCFRCVLCLTHRLPTIVLPIIISRASALSTLLSALCSLLSALYSLLSALCAQFSLPHRNRSQEPPPGTLSFLTPN